MKEKSYKFLVRLPATMRDLIAESAQHYRRSMNSDIVARLQHSFSGIPDDVNERGLAPPLHEQLEHLFKRELSVEEEQLVRTYRRLNKEKRAALLDLLI
jgi:hypothetical protein